MGKRKAGRNGPQLNEKPVADVSPDSGGSATIVKWFFGLFRKGNVVLLSLLAFVLTVWLFLPSLLGQFHDFDDSIYVYANVHINSGLTWRSIGWAFCDFTGGNWHPLTSLSHMMDCELYGLKPWGHHLTSVLLHGINTVLLFLVLRRMTGATWRSLAVAGLFGLHPLRLESVAWISERKDVLCTTLWMLTMWAYSRYVEQSKVQCPKSKSFYGLTLLFFSLSLMSKPLAVTLPCVLLLLDYWPLERWKQKSSRSLVMEKVPFFLLTAIVSIVTYIAQKGAGMMIEMQNVALGTRLENALVSYVRYVGKLFWPVDLCALYPYPGRWPLGTVVLAGLFVLGVLVLVFVTRRQRPYLLTGWLWYLGTLVPMIGLVQVGTQAMADRYTYIPVIGILIALVWGVCEMTRGWRYQTMSLCAIGGLAIFGCIGLTSHQIGFWKDDVTLWRRAVAVTEKNYDAHNRLARALIKQQRLDEAIHEFQEAVKLKPDFAEAQANLCQSLVLNGQVDKAILQYQNALKILPTDGRLLNKFGVVLSDQGRIGEALSLFQMAVGINSNDSGAHHNLGHVLIKMGRTDEAIAHFQRAIEIDPDNEDFYNSLGYAFLVKNQTDEAIRAFQEALRLKRDYAAARNNLNTALAMKEASEKQQNIPTSP